MTVQTPWIGGMLLLCLLAVPARAAVPALGAWDARSADAEAAPGYNDRHWAIPGAARVSTGDAGLDAYTWYRASVNAPAEGSYNLRLVGGLDRAHLYVNGDSTGVGLGPDRLVDLKRGANRIAILAANDAGATPTVAGTLATLSSSPAHRMEITDWRWTLAPDRQAAEHLAADTSGVWADWALTRPGEAVMSSRDRWAVFAASLPSVEGALHEARFTSVDDNAIIYLNGRRVGAHEGWGVPFGVSLDEAWNAGRPNTLMVVVENTDGQGGLSGPVELRSFRGGSDGAISGWKARAGLALPDASPGWQPFQHVTGRPTWYRSHFTLPSSAGKVPALRFETGPLGRGLAWLNGQPLGPYPTGPGLSRLDIPANLLRPGRNTLVVFDEYGRMPTGARIVADETASR